MKQLLKHTRLLIILLTIIGFVLHFYNLNWGAPYYFHPDERNVAASASQLSFPDRMNPAFFAYGSLPIYAIYFSALVIKPLLTMQFLAPPGFNVIGATLNAQITFELAVIVSRIYSALLATLLIPLLYILGKRLHSPAAGLLASFFALTAVGFIQFSHFGTFELWLTFFSTLLFWNCLEILRKPSATHMALAGLTTGILISIKVSSLAMIPLPFLALLCTIPFKKLIKDKALALSVIRRIFQPIIIFLGITGLIYFITNPYSIITYPNFQNSIHYESVVAFGTLPVFYTQEFYKAVPVLFHFLHVYPFLINPLLTFLFIPSLLFICSKIYREKSKAYLFLIVFYLIVFLPQAFLFVKWTRYMVPTIPFMLLIISISFLAFLGLFKKLFLVYSGMLLIMLTVCSLFAIAYVSVVLATTDSRVAARDWTRIRVSRDNVVMSEIYEIGIVPFNEIFSHITLCNNYYLETTEYPCDGQSLDTVLDNSQLIILPSQRLYKTRFTDPQRYPKGAAFYEALFSGKTQFHKIYQTPCNALCNILYLGSPVFSFEQTATVFDRPVVTIFQKS